MKILVSEKLSQHKYKTPEGYLICTDAILARTGKQTYTRDELFGDGDRTEVDVDRPYEQVMNEKTIASFENKPVTFDHPDEDVNVGNYKDYAVGYVRDVHQSKVNGQDVIVGNLVITDQDAINAIESGEHTDLSCGYDCDIRDDGSGNYAQNNIRGNHVALCKEGRAGMAKIIDSIAKKDSIRDANITYKLRRAKNDYEEYVVQAYKDGKKYEVATYYTDDWQDALATIQAIARKQGLNFRQQGSVYIADKSSVSNDSINISDAKPAWFKGIYNGDLKSFDIRTLIEHIKKKQTALHVNLGAADAVYNVAVFPALFMPIEDGKDTGVVIDAEYADGTQKRLIATHVNSWNELINLYNKFKSSVHDSLSDSKVDVVDQRVKDSKWSADWSDLEVYKIDSDNRKEVEDLTRKLASKYGLSGRVLAMRPYPELEFSGNRKNIEKLIYNEYVGRNNFAAKEEYEFIEDSVRSNSKTSSKMSYTDALKFVSIIKSFKSNDAPMYEPIKTQVRKINIYGTLHTDTLRKFHDFISQYRKETNRIKKNTLADQIKNDYKQLAVDFRYDIASARKGEIDATEAEIKKHYDKEVNQWTAKIPELGLAKLN